MGEFGICCRAESMIVNPLSQRPRLFLTLIIGCLVIFMLPYLHAVPAWDGGWYTACLLNAAEAQFHLKNFNCVGHTSFAYMLLLAIGQYIDYGNLFLMQGINLLLWCCACIFFYKLSGEIYKKEINPENFCLLTGILAFAPAITGNLLQLNLDFGVLVFFIPTLYFLIKRSFIALTLSGTLMVFTKETGAALYLITIFWGVTFFELRNLSQIRIKKNLLNFTLLVFPLIIYAARTLYRYLRHPGLNLFYTEDGYQFEERSFLEMAFDFNFWQPTFKAYLIDIFALQFNWILTAAALAGLFYCSAKKQGGFDSLKTKRFLFVIFLFLSVIYLVTRHRPFNHLRYIIVALPLFYLFTYGLITAAFKESCKRFLLWCVLLLTIFSNIRTIDPLSKFLFGTIPLGKQELLNMSAYFFVPNSVHSKFNRDEIVYNLEYTKLHEISEMVFQDIKLHPRLTFMGSQDSRFFWPGLVDEKNLRRTGKRQGVFKPHYFDYVEEFADVVEKPITLYYLEFPTMISDNQDQKLKRWYTYSHTTSYSIDGYEMKVKVYKKN